LETVAVIAGVKGATCQQGCSVPPVATRLTGWVQSTVPAQVWTDAASSALNPVSARLKSIRRFCSQSA